MDRSDGSGSDAVRQAKAELLGDLVHWSRPDRRRTEVDGSKSVRLLDFHSRSSQQRHRFLGLGKTGEVNSGLLHEGLAITHQRGFVVDEGNVDVLIDKPPETLCKAQALLDDEVA